MKKVKVLISAVALLVSSASNAAIISYNGYEYDDESTTNIVTGGGLEWLRWDQTTGMSIDTAVTSDISGGGWSLASNTQMADLFNAFEFGLTFTNAEGITQYINTAVEAGEETGTDLTFVSMFGNTYGDSYADYADNGEGPLEASRALFGSDADGDGFYNLAEVYDDYRSPDSATDPGLARLNGDFLGYISSSYGTQFGIALVREIGTSDSGDGSTTVPEPSVLALFGAGLLGLGFVRRRKQS